MVTAFSRLTVDLTAIAENYALFQRMTAPGCGIAGVVKANAYGLGAAQVAPVLDSLGCPLFFVATLDEGIALRRVTATPIAILGGLLPGAEGEYRAHTLIPVMNSPEEVRRGTYSGPCFWHIDTGMNRLGIRPEELEGLKDCRPPDLVMSHFACADDRDHEMTARQGRVFAEIAASFPDSRKSLCNSSGLFRHPEWHYDMVRPGMALTGLNPTPEAPNPMRRTVTLDARLLQIHTAKAGETVGYSATYTASHDTRIGIAGIGYADGFLRSGSGRAVLYHNGRPCPVLGRISMDLTAIDLGPAPDAQVGDWIEILGPHQDPDALAASCGTIGYEILTDLGPRHLRTYLPLGSTGNSV